MEIGVPLRDLRDDVVATDVLDKLTLNLGPMQLKSEFVKKA